MLTPVSISAFPVRGYSVAEDVVGVNTFMQSPLVVAGRPLNAWECYNYKSSVQITGCNPGPPSLEVGGRTSLNHRAE